MGRKALNPWWERDENKKILAMRLCSIFGATDHQLAEFLGVSYQEINKWKAEDDEFREVLQVGKTMADFRVAECFFKSCTGYEYEEEVVNVFKGKATKTTIKKWKPGDPWSQAKWLSLRQRADWSESQKFEITNTNININKIDFGKLTKEEMLLIEQIQLKQLGEHATDN